MKRKTKIPILVVLPILALLLNACASEPTCSAPPPTTVGETREFQDHSEVDIAFGSRCEKLSGTLFLPVGSGPFQAVVFVHGAQPPYRLHYGTGFLEKVIASGIAVYSYDKHGSGESEGECCPGNGERFALLANDVAAAAERLKTRPEIDSGSIGLLGVSQGGWVIPLSLEQTDDVSYAVIMSGPAVSVGLSNWFDNLTDEGTDRKEAIQRLDEAKQEFFDPRPYLESMKVPTLWLYGELDEDQPTEASVATLEALGSPDITIRVFPGVGHNLVPHPELVPTIAEWITAR